LVRRSAIALRKRDRVKSGVGVAWYGIVRVTAVGGQRREIAVRTAAAKPSKPVTGIDYSCIAGAIRGFRQVSTSSEK
jgi:hypothetical protein